MTHFAAAIEALLFVGGESLTEKKLADILEITPSEVRTALTELETELNQPHRGIHLINRDGEVRLVTNPACSEEVGKFVKKNEDPGELTRPGLETLTVIAYRGPVTRAEIEAIRGVQCSLILRNLSLRGLIEEREGREGEEVWYTLSEEAVRYLGLHSVRELPEYERLHGDARIDELLAALTKEETV